MRAGRRIIALVDDNPLLRVPLAQTLDAAGYTVIGAANGPEAVALLEDADIDVGLVDIKLPGRLDGVGVVRQAKRANPALKVIFISGQPPREDLSSLGAFLAKPFRFGELVQAIERLIAADRPGRSGDPNAPDRLER